MNTSVLPCSMVAREELEQAWRLKAEEAQELYHVVTEQYRKLLEKPTGLMPAGDSPLIPGRRAQSSALEELKRVLRIFTGFAAHGRIPEAELTENGVRH